MKVCVVAYAVYKYDPRVLRETEGLSALGADVDVIALRDFRPTGNSPFEVYHGVRIHRLQERNFYQYKPHQYLLQILSFFFRSLVVVTRLSLRRRYDIVHVHSVPDFEVFAALAPKLRGAKIILDIHDLLPEFYRRKFAVKENHPIIKILKWLERLSCAFADHVITVNEMCREKLVQRSVPADKCSIVMNVPDPRIFKPGRKKPKAGGDSFTLVYPGTISEQHGVDILIRAMELVKKEISGVKLHIIGKDRKGEAARLVRTLKLEKFVSVRDSVPVSTLSELVQKADVGVVPQRGGVFVEDALPTKLMEFVFLGIPAVVSRIKATEAYFDDSMVMFFEPENVEDLARCIIELYRHPEKRKTLARNAMKFSQEHNWGKYMRNYCRILDRITDGRHRLLQRLDSAAG